jgi:formamidopyrimidine-DNA glycosylase
LFVSSPEVDLKSHITHIDCIGKEAFIHFSTSPQNGFVIRLHFGMNGSEMVSHRLHTCVVSPAGCNVCDINVVVDTSRNQPKHSRKQLSCVMIFTDYYLCIYDSVVQVKTIRYYSDIYSKRDRNIMIISCYDQVAHLLKEDSRSISDSIMDQDVLPGVGNIIKCEGLFRTKIHPMRLSRDMSHDVLIQLVHNLQEFSIDWYKCTEKNKQVHMDIYGMDSCHVCQRAVSLIRQGQYDRITYFCNNCQPLSQSSHGMSADGAAINKDPNLFCNDTSHANILTPTFCHCKSQSKLNRVRKQGVNANRLFWSCSLNMKSHKRCTYFAWADTTFPTCHHGCVSILRRVLKPGVTNGRYFYCCGKDKTEQCKYFEWL